jgi:hypothetical protein
LPSVFEFAECHDKNTRQTNFFLKIILPSADTRQRKKNLNGFAKCRH